VSRVSSRGGASFGSCGNLDAIGAMAHLLPKDD